MEVVEVAAESSWQACKQCPQSVAAPVQQCKLQSGSPIDQTFLSTDQPVSAGVEEQGRYVHQPGRSVQISEDQPEHHLGCTPGRLKNGLIFQADLTIILADQFKSWENCPEHRPIFELADIYRHEVTKGF
ncbi:hypothetical protein MA16_Dca009784 [Dendrobium catenatum]|uniref:Uncharacterized protein n=1 Tax=Dendrobium catenatum TaxID=906689 RepID=A0A2I0XI69_9ASPA|nr:hypothetical protein MA16_Dca009784 [Dendrobium catenatum]